jgi:hypothetical protein
MKHEIFNDIEINLKAIKIKDNSGNEEVIELEKFEDRG